MGRLARRPTPPSEPTYSDDTRAVPTRPPLWRDVRVLGQVAAVDRDLPGLAVADRDLATNYGRLNIGFDFGFLFRPTQFQIPNHREFDPRSPVWRMVLVGVKNTALAGIFGVALAGVLGLIIGIGRLSQNLAREPGSRPGT